MISRPAPNFYFSIIHLKPFLYHPNFPLFNFALLNFWVGFFLTAYSLAYWLSLLHLLPAFWPCQLFTLTYHLSPVPLGPAWISSLGWCYINLNFRAFYRFSRSRNISSCTARAWHCCPLTPILGLYSRFKNKVLEFTYIDLVLREGSKSSSPY